MASLVLSGDTSGSITVSAPAVAGSNTQTLVAVTDTLAPLVRGTSVTASGTSVDFTSIPSWVKRITVMFSGVSTNGSSNWQIRLGTSGGVEATGYSSASMYCSTSGLNAVNSTTGFQFHNIAAAYNANGSMTITNLTGNTWTETGSVSNTTGGDFMFFSSGAKTLSGTLDRVRITTVNGTDTFDAGSINILYE